VPRQSRGPHLYLKARKDGDAVWYIRDGGSRTSTGCGAGDREGAREALERHLARTARPNFGSRDPAAVRVADIIALYAQDRANATARPKETGARLARLLSFFKTAVADEITPSSCAAYVRARGAEQAARRELEDLRAALRHAFKSRKIACEIPIALPEKSPPRERWLERGEAARLIAAALGWRFAPCCDIATRRERLAIWGRPGERNRHVARFVLIGLYTATRHDAILGLGWRVHTDGGHVDLARGVLYRAPPGARQTAKRRPPVAIPPALAPHLARWSQMPAAGLYIVTWDGSRMDRMQRAWRGAVARAGLGPDVTPHILRHTAITWRLHEGWSIWDVAGFAGATAEMIERVYGHHAEAFRTPKRTPKRA